MAHKIFCLGLFQGFVNSGYGLNGMAHVSSLFGFLSPHIITPTSLIVTVFRLHDFLLIFSSVTDYLSPLFFCPVTFQPFGCCVIFLVQLLGDLCQCLLHVQVCCTRSFQLEQSNPKLSCLHIANKYIQRGKALYLQGHAFLGYLSIFSAINLKVHNSFWDDFVSFFIATHSLQTLDIHLYQSHHNSLHYLAVTLNFKLEHMLIFQICSQKANLYIVEAVMALQTRLQLVVTEQ